MPCTINKKETLLNSSFEQTMNFDYTMSIGVVLEGIAHTSQVAFMQDVCSTLAANGYEVGSPADTPYGNDATSGFGLEVINVRVQPLSDSSARAVITYGTPVVPATTNLDDEINWIWEGSSSVRTEQQGWDVDKKAISVKYWPYLEGEIIEDWMDSDEWHKDDNQRRFNQTHTATKYRPWQTEVCRARIRWDWIQLNGAEYHPRNFQSRLTGFVNDVIDSGDAAKKAATKGIWLCQGVQVSSPNNGLIWDVRCTFARNDFGWDTVIFFTDPNNQNKIPKFVAEDLDNAQNANFKLPYPDDADRVLKNFAPETDTAGGVRPKMHKLLDFKQSPYFIDLMEVTK